ncbi:MAG: oxaloacetate decarboxylase subunit gamma [Paraglaciecola sp.]|nr:oxaloacetate decarboxylase subunit gamma [Paraglaciecola sp.]NCT46622.1 oxaloacetate decarboxylase subunit gamma [Paraglaciecola sp.]
MAVSSVLAEAAYLLLVGMTVVYGFLALMILTIKLVERLDKKWPVSLVSNSATTMAVKPTTDSLPVNESTSIVVAITAAIHQYR